MATPQSYTLRPLERRIPLSSLEGGFRVHLANKELKNLGLHVGDLCRIWDASGKSGFAVAWNAQETNPSKRPIAKVTELLREKYGFGLTEPVFIEKVTDHFRKVDVVTVSLEDPSQPFGSYESARELQNWASFALGENLSLFSI